MRTPRPILFASAAALALAAACSDGAAGGPTIAGAPEPAPALSPFFSTAPAEQDSVQSGYGNECTGGLDYTIFEYDPDTGTEYVVCSDTVVRRDTTVRSTPAPPPPPAP